MEQTISAQQQVPKSKKKIKLAVIETANKSENLELLILKFRRWRKRTRFHPSKKHLARTAQDFPLRKSVQRG